MEEIPVELSDGTLIYIQAKENNSLEERGLFSNSESKINTALHTLSTLSKDLKRAFDEGEPDKVTVELGMEFGVKSGQLSAILVQGSASANLKITMEWNKKDS